MYWFLLKKALPFTLTFVFGAALSGLTGLFGSSEKKSEWVVGTRTYDYGRSCRTRPRNLVAESKPLTILFKPDAPAYLGTGTKSVRVNVTFGADGKVQKVRHLHPLVLTDVTREKVEEAARQIEFTPQTVNGIPVTVEKEVEIHLVGG
jgi:hypothetical protein